MSYIEDEKQRRIFSENLRRYIEKSGKTQKDISIDLNVNPPTFSMWVKGKALPSVSVIRKIADYFSVGLTDLVDEHTTEKSPIMSNPIGPTRIPVYSAAGAGKPQPTSDDILFYTDYNGDPDGVLGVQIKGDSMAPTIPDNSLVIVNSNLQIESGDIVVAQVNSDHEALCKRIKKYEDGLSLISDNPAYPPLYFTAQQVQELPVRFVGKCTEVRKKL